MNINKITLQHNKEFITFIFLFIGFITMYNLKKRLIDADFEFSCKRCSWTIEKKQNSD